MARDAMAGRPVAQYGFFHGAAIEDVGTTGAETAAGRRVERARDVAVQHDALAARLALRIGNRNRGDQGLRVRMLRPAHQLVGRCHLDDLAQSTSPRCDRSRAAPPRGRAR